MRKAINENPVVQMAVLGIAAVAFAFILFTSVLKKDDPAASTAADPAAATATADSTPTTVAPAAAPAPAAVDPAAATPPATTQPPAAEGGSVADGLLPSEGLPKELLVAFAKNKTIALLVIDPNGISDKKVESYTKALRSRDDVEVFIVDVRDIADYSRVTAGVSVSRVPALLVIPRASSPARSRPPPSHTASAAPAASTRRSKTRSTRVSRSPLTRRSVSAVGVACRGTRWSAGVDLAGEGRSGTSPHRSPACRSRFSGEP
jgi:hypothetical protein